MIPPHGRHRLSLTVERLLGLAWRVEEFWARQVAQRELYRLLDGARLLDECDKYDE
ncbi:hypothetical protein ACFV0R_17490 [Streptomyces sp. NPDC059578]|uniref:hypothetical protein n=1 Tax=Streptomyces sp. NPDC059578 TaxID=3346874 RepID=UPI003687C9BE